jgi:hypothetical protein
MTYDGIVRNGAIMPEHGATLPEGTHVVPESAGDESKPTHLGLLTLAGIAKDLPADFAEQHDHYLHGTPK